MKRTLSSLIAAAFLAAAPTLALAEDGGRGPAGGAFMSSCSTPAAPYRGQAFDGAPYGASSSAFALQSEVRDRPQPGQQRRPTRSAR